MATDMGAFLANLQKQMEEALTPEDDKTVSKSAAPNAEIAELRTSIDAMREGVTALTKAFAPADDKGENAGEIASMLKEMRDTLTTHGEVLEKALDRLERVEGVTVIRKSVDGDDFTGDDDKKSGDKSGDVAKARGGGGGSVWGPVVKGLIEGQKVRLVG